MPAKNIHVMVPWLKVPGEKPKFLLENFGKTMKILVLKWMPKKARVDMPEVNHQL